MPTLRRRAVVRVVRRSRTIFGSLTALGATIAGIFNEAVSVALEAAAQLTMLAPVVSVGTALGLETRTVTAGIAVAGIALALFARLDDAARGAHPK
jgi:hypothetical protein